MIPTVPDDLGSWYLKAQVPCLSAYRSVFPFPFDCLWLGKSATTEWSGVGRDRRLRCGFPSLVAPKKSLHSLNFISFSNKWILMGGIYT